MSFIKLENILNKSIKKAGIKKQLDTALALDNFSEIIADIFGAAAKGKIQPMYLGDGVLNIACLSDILAQEIKFKEQEIINRLNQPYSKKVVEQLRILV
ncbi:MAG: DUF721 domain-containing protein [Patescibacteria group bacterium]|nr:DUF721 domain-containing protein [Patescibacteria group bacterium]